MNEPKLEVQHYEEDGLHVLQLRGWVDADDETFQTFEEALHKEVEEGKNRIKVDCQGLSYILEEGIELLIETQRKVRQHGGTFIIHITHHESANWKLNGMLRHYYPVLFDGTSDS